MGVVITQQELPFEVETPPEPEPAVVAEPEPEPEPEPEEVEEKVPTTLDKWKGWMNKMMNVVTE
jgi:hypothetical protein